jgi:hypothetical protein
MPAGLPGRVARYVNISTVWSVFLPSNLAVLATYEAFIWCGRVACAGGAAAA